MKKALLATILFASTSLASAQETVSVGFVNGAGQDNGTANLTATPGGVLIELEVSGLPAGQWVAFHVHETGSCDHTTGHDSAGGHFNPTDKTHGFLSAEGPHAGDMPNQYVSADGILRAQVYNDRVRLNREKDGILGRALMIHAQADDYQSQPSGNAGKRLACGVIE
ncbi:superoxide dismutase family protein [Mesorhizobium sp. VNQ89]|uniref:superoxide dismutase family protein n=1 Tax=Mesorhizobium quangtriensis TaxID=3157709 RepID=UPI0032B819B7